MTHVLILGMTESGKTTLAKELARKYKASNMGVLVLDPLQTTDWAADYNSADPDEFLNVFWDSKGCAVFIDESGDAVGKYDLAMTQTATRGRHWGHRVHYITQRGASISRTVRDQCSHMFLFRSGKQDCKIHAEEWARDELVNANQLGAGEYYHVTRFGELTKSNIFDEINRSK